MKRERLHLSVHTNVETGVDWNGRYYIAYTNGASMFFRCPKEARKWLKLPVKIPSREAYDSWIASLEAADAERDKRKAAKEEGLSDELLATGFGPEVHLDETDPNYQTKMIT